MNLAKILLNRHLSDLLSKGAAFSFFQILGKILGFLYAWLIVKWFGDSAWGQLVFAITIVMILKNTGQFGFQNALTKFIASNNKDKTSSAVIFYYKKTMMFVISLSLLLTFIFYFNARWVSV